MSDHSKMTATQVREEQDRIELAERARLRELSAMPCSAKIAMDETILYAAMHAAAITDMDHENAPYGEGDLVALWLHQNEMKHIVRSTVRELHKRGRFLS